MTASRHTRRRTRATAPAPRVGLFGLLGQGNVGNDGSMGAMLAYLRGRASRRNPGCPVLGPEQVTARYGIPAARLSWYRPERQRARHDGPRRQMPEDRLGMVIDAVRTASWVRRHDVVIVPGMGVLEATLPLRPWQTPYSMFLLCASGRLFGTKVALVSVGANIIHQRLTRWLITAAARLRVLPILPGRHSRDAMRQMGVDTSGDAVYPDVAFSLPRTARRARCPGGCRCRCHGVLGKQRGPSPGGRDTCLLHREDDPFYRLAGRQRSPRKVGCG